MALKNWTGLLSDDAKGIPANESFSEMYARVLLEAEQEADNIIETGEDIKPADAGKSEDAEPEAGVKGSEEPEAEAPQKQEGDTPDPAEEGKAGTESDASGEEVPPAEEGAPAADSSEVSEVSDAPPAEEEAAAEEVEKAAEEAEEEAGAVEDTSEMYDRLAYTYETIHKFGIGKPLAAGFNYNNELYDAIPVLPALESLPELGDPTDGNTKIACEALDNGLKGFWEWIKEAMRRIQEVFSNLFSKIAGMYENVVAQIDKNSGAIKGMTVNELKWTGKEAILINVTEHMKILKVLPNLGTEIIQSGNKVMMKNYSDIKAYFTRGQGHLGSAGKSLAAGAAGGAVTAAGAAAAAPIGGIAAPAITVGGIGAGAAVAGVGVVFAGIFAAAALKNFVQFGIKLSKSGVVDMSDFNSNRAFEPTKNLLNRTGWTTKNTVDGKPVVNAMALVRQAERMAKTIVGDLQKVEKEAAADVKSNPDAKNVSAARKAVQAKIQAATNMQKLVSGMSLAAMKVGRNFVAAQRAILSCAQ